MKVGGILCRCDGGCGTRSTLEEIDGQIFDPPGWEHRGDRYLCPECQKSVGNQLHPEVVKAADRAIFMLQCLMMSELHGQTGDKSSMTYGADGMPRRMKRCELLARYADSIMTVYGNVVGFRLASDDKPIVGATLAQVATALEDLMKVEVAYSAARSVKERKPTSRLSGHYSYALGDSESDDVPAMVAGPLFRLQEVSRVAQKLAQLAITRAGQVVAKNAEDEVLDDAADAWGAVRGRITMGHGGAADPLRELLGMLEGMMRREEERRDTIFNKPIVQPFHIERDAVADLDYLLSVRERVAAAGTAIDASALEAIDAKIKLAEARLRVQTQETAVDSALAAEASAKDVTPSATRSVEHKFNGTGMEKPPSDDEILRMARDLGVDSVREAFPEAWARLAATAAAP